MSEVWLTIGVLTVTTAMIRASGPVVLGGRDLPPRAQGVIALLAPALLAALVVVETFSAPRRVGPFELDARIAGVAAAAPGAARGRLDPADVALAALVTALDQGPRSEPPRAAQSGVRGSDLCPRREWQRSYGSDSVVA